MKGKREGKRQSEQGPKTKQNYVPFFSKSPRFQEGKSAAKYQEVGEVMMEQGGRISIKNSVHASPNKHQPVQYIFKSSTERFSTLMAEETPSPGQYTIEPTKRMKTLDSNSRVKENSSNRQCTLPTIPDKRNRFGVSFETKEASFVQKSELQLKREKELMKKYRESLSESTSMKKSAMTPVGSEFQLQRKVKAHLSSNFGSQKENKGALSKSQSDSKRVVQHLYEYHPVDSGVHPSPFLGCLDQWQKKGKRTKFQFFDSTQKRFKDLGVVTKGEPTLKRSVRNYLEKMAAISSK